MRGVDVNDDTLMLDLIDEVGPGGNFLTAESTAKRCRTEIWNPTLFDRKPWDIWQTAGARTVEERLQAKLNKILGKHASPPLPTDAAEKMAAVLETAEAREARHACR